MLIEGEGKPAPAETVKSRVVSNQTFSTTAARSGAGMFKKVAGMFVAGLMMALTAQPASAASGPKYAGIVVDAKTGNVLYSENADNLRYPASLTKMMTLYLVFEQLESGKIRLDTKVPVSKNAAAEPPSKLGLRPGGSFTIEQGILALVTRSANDAATALGEFVGGSEARFAKMMTNKAHALGMTRTTYRNANGLPNTAQMTTARDQARLGIALRQHFPQYYHYFSTRSFQYGKQVIGNHNRLLGAVKGVDGIKTGYTRAAGFNLVTSAEVGGRSIVGVVLGAPSGGARNEKMKRLVAAYLPQASRKGNGQLIAETAPEPAASMEQATASVSSLPATGPMPSARYQGETTDQEPVETAYAGSAAAAAEVVPQTAPAYAPESDGNAGTAAIDKVTTASTRAADGWVIQVGVSPSKKMAMDLLESAQSKGGKVLRSATPFAVAINNGGGELYRARFSGFGDQKDAVNACKVLKRKGVNCWASLQ